MLIWCAAYMTISFLLCLVLWAACAMAGLHA